MQRSVYQHKILDTIAASGADIGVKNRYIYINGVQMWKQDDVEKDGITFIPNVQSVTAAVLTYSVPAVPTNSTVYTIQVTVPNPNAQGDQQNPLVLNIPVTTPSTGTLANTDLVTLFKTAINSVYQGYNTYFVATGTTTLILTATTVYPVMIGGVTAPITVVQTTAGVNLQGNVAQMESLGVTVNSVPAQLGAGNPNNTIWVSGTAGTLAGTYYDAYFCASALNIGEQNTIRQNQEFGQYLWINSGSGNAASFESILNAVLGGFLRNGTTINWHELETKNFNPGVQ